MAACSPVTSAEPPPTQPSIEVDERDDEPADPPREDHAWDAVDDAMAQYEEVVADGWLEPGQPVWLRNGDGCTRFTPERDGDDLSGKVELCSRDHGRKRVRCEQSVTFSEGSLSLGMVLCQQTNPDGTGRGSGAGSSQSPSWSALRIDQDVVELGTGYRLWVEPERLVWVTSACEPGTVDAARGALKSEGVADVDRALFDRFGVMHNEQRCRVDEGVELFWRDAADRGIYDRGAQSKTLPDPVDCSLPCPANPRLEEFRARNAALAGRRFHRIGEPPTAHLYLSEAACEGAAHQPLISASCEPLDSP